ncbi:Hypothetical protein A7982_04719 [Minicystis rosea]|nr:Hypothetical protein A7982_04719 [Minicystis rosea]
MASIRLTIEPTFVGPASAGTVRVIELLRRHLDMSLTEAKRHVDACVFDGATVEMAAPSLEAAEALVAALAELEAPPRVDARVVRS